MRLFTNLSFIFALFVITSCSPVTNPELQTLRIISGANQRGLTGSTLDNELVIKAIDKKGNGISDLSIQFKITKGGGSISPKNAETNDKGIVKATWELGNKIDSALVKVKPQNSNLKPLSINATILSHLDEWLFKHDKIAKSINWILPDEEISYENWSPEKRVQLFDTYTKITNGNFRTDDYPPENLVSSTSEEFRTIISKEDAWNLYLANIANSIAVEKNGKTEWSILSDAYSEEALATLFDAKSFYRESMDRNDEVVYEVNGYVLPSKPHYLLTYLKEKNILVQDRLETISRLIDWSAVNLSHFLYGYELTNFESHWNYAGAIPINEIIEGTKVPPEITNYNPFRHWTAGCHGTNHFYRSILRNINIPVKYERVSGHATPYFVTENLYLSHGDDPYNLFFSSKPAINPKKLLISDNTWNKWFSGNLSVEVRSNNIGRRAVELGVEQLSIYLLQKYCHDMEDNLSIGEGDVSKSLSNVYSLSELKEMNLWEKMDDKLTSLGGCKAIEWDGERDRPSYF